MTFGELTSGHRDVCSVGTPCRACVGKCGQMHCKTTFSSWVLLSFWLANGPFFGREGWWSGCYQLVGPGTLGLVVRKVSLVGLGSSFGWVGLEGWKGGRGGGGGGRGGGVVHLIVVHGYQGAEEDAEKLSLTDKLLQAVPA